MTSAESLFANMKAPEPYKTDLTFAACAADAASKGLVVRIPKTNELFVDIDSDEDHDFFVQRLARLEEMLTVLSVVVTPSKSGGERRHIVVTLEDDVSNERRILLQALLGSDRVREFLSFARHEAGNPTPTLFFEKPEHVELVEHIEAT